MNTEHPYKEWEINPDVSVAWKRADDAAFRESKRRGTMFFPQAPTHDEIAARIGQPLYVRRRVPLP